MSPDSAAAAAATAQRWKVLLVDDEPAVHEISRLILADLVFEGRELELLSATSAAQARDLLARHGDVALILLDVVMETDDAGVALVQHVRGTLGNGDVQIVLRTGQPGMAPEREVVQRYEINGYCLKTDLTAQRMHSIVVSALRNYRHSRTLRALAERDAPPRPGAAAARGRAGALVAEIERAHEGGGVVLQAQPEVDLASNRVCGIELVPQWRTSQGLISTARVLEEVPEGPLRSRIALWLLEQGCRWSRSWGGEAGAAPTVSVPVVADALRDADTLDAVAAAVRAAALPPRALDLLMTEASLSEADADLRVAMATLRALGVTFTLVDFGAHTIALQQLSRLVPDRLKIHRPLARDVAAVPDQRALARSLIALAQTLNITAIADGLASDADAQFFKWEGCELGQGDALAPACALADVAAYLREGRKVAH